MRGSTHTTPVPIAGTAMVTGGTSGIGLAFARALAARGCDLVLVARNRQRLDATAEELRSEHGIAVETLVADLARRADVGVVARRLEDAAAPVDVLVNNAGMGVHTPLTSTEVEVHDEAIDVMIRAVLVLGAAAARTMSERGTGIIVNVASVAGQVAMGSYSAIKSWVATYSESLSLEMEGSGVQVMTLMPGWVRTEFHERAKIRTSSIPDALWLDADELVADCLADLERGRTQSIPSKRFKVVSWCANHFPRPLVRRATALIKKGRR
ncbi:SDR family NAD(P)-dependent oxidoreductase [Ruania suaedae]|uniref:SDR family NAD(P)-dependent oxidoreductase n=1 Tax=Ruania suaedae TaxID=2897774 RepID=UPI001E3D131B|nr:SDR family NAD(P)-dependent oxidoreductase [Ruania suaedae]UFU03152.1 SDR family NAD(P)-dependent oxidoreductase [Ruania suaedae]